MTTQPRHPRHPRLQGAAASLAIVGTLIGLPAVLLALGWGTLPAGDWWTLLTTPDDGRLTLTLLKAAGWIVWAVLVVLIAAETVGLVRGVRAPRLPGLRWTQPGIQRLVTTAMLLFTAIPATVQVANATPAHAATQPVETTPRHAIALDKATANQASTRTHTVRAGDSLWSIAERYLGSGRRYPEIAALNMDLLNGHSDFLRPGWTLTLPAAENTTTPASGTVIVQPGDTLSGIARTHLGDETAWPTLNEASRGTVQPDGGRLTNPDLILPGWTITLPTPAAQPSAPVTVPAPDPVGSRPQTPDTDPTVPTTAPSARPQQPEVAPAPLPTAGVAVPTSQGQASQPGAQPAPATAAPETTATIGPATTPTGLLPGLLGAGAILGGGLYLGLKRRRRTQFRARRPGRTIAPTPPDLVRVEQTIRQAAQAVPTVGVVEQALRLLGCSAPAVGVPGLRAVELLPGRLAVHLTTATHLLAPWQPVAGDTTGARWTLDTSGELPAASGRAPYPLLVTVGRDDHGASWLINLEHLGALQVTGEPERARDFARYLAAELAVNPWSRETRVDCLGDWADVTALDPTRLRHHELDRADGVLQQLQQEAQASIDRCDTHQVDAANGRVDDLGDDLWTSCLLLTDPTTPGLEALLDLIATHPGGTGTVAILTGDPTGTRGVQVSLTEQGRLVIADLGLDLAAVGLTSDEARGCALLLAHAGKLTDAPMPTEGDDGWRANSDAAGALRDDFVLPRDIDPDTLDEIADSLLPLADADLVAELPATEEDLQTLAPLVPVHVRTRVEASDDQLDADLAAWFDPDTDRPRIHLLGPVRATVGPGRSSEAAEKRTAFYTELASFLALHPNGVTMDQVTDAFLADDMQMRKHLSVLRTWFGTDPTTGQPYLPAAHHSPGGKTRGVGVYQLMGVLVDIDLFRRLRVRGEARASDGLADLQAALSLVEGEPFTGLRNGGWRWLDEGTRHDHHMVCAVVDVAHAVTLANLHHGNLPAARTAAEIGILAAPYEDTPHVDLAAVIAREGDPDAAQRLINDQICNRTEDGEAPDDLPDRTDHLIRDRRWLTATGKVA